MSLAKNKGGARQLMLMICTTNDSRSVQWFGLWNSAPGQLLPWPKEDVADLLSKYLM